ncbi:MAG: T9SS type A sorting domain-containing protein, partial [Bacteroidales bacterium]|nr:T9SS type A sorting domain-containing protein [Bacteroidales bacterium]
GDNFEVKVLANEAAEGLAFRLYPNPTTGVFYVEVAESARMEIFTVGGVMVRSAELRAGKNELRLDRSGIYFVRLTNAHGAAVNRVIVR